MKYLLTFIFLCIISLANAQSVIETNPDLQPINAGGKVQAERIVETQIVIPDVFMKHPDKSVTIYFTVGKDGKTRDIFFKDDYATYYKNESRRLLRYFVFDPAKKNNVTVDAYGSLTFNFSPAKYKTYLKERNRNKISIDPDKCDTSFVIYEVADKSPEYVKGEEELKEFILNEMDYPNVARNQNIEGTVVLSFIVETNGYISNIKALKEIGGGCTDEAIRIMGLTRWMPAKKGEKLVRYKTTYPITFSIKNVNHDHSSSGQ